MKSVSLIILLVAATRFVGAPADWVLCETKNCMVLFPGKPTATTQMVSSAIGPLKLDINLYEVPRGSQDDNFIYLLNETAYPDSLVSSDKKEILDNFFSRAIDGAVSRVHGKLLTEKAIALGKYPGREIRINFQQGRAVIKMRMYLVKSILFMLETITDPKFDGNKSIDRFMDSFQLRAEKTASS
jgi:hypothetical protein